MPLESHAVEGLLQLKRLQPGQSPYVSSNVCRPDHVHRLEEFGLRGGTKIQMFRPGNPCIIRMAGTKICMRADEMLDILVLTARAG
jgi:Fe2+ transport system protein FeoA